MPRQHPDAARHLPCQSIPATRCLIETAYAAALDDTADAVEDYETQVGAEDSAIAFAAGKSDPDVLPAELV